MQSDFENATTAYLVALDGYLAAAGGQPLAAAFGSVPAAAQAEQAYKQALAASLGAFPSAAFNQGGSPNLPGTDATYGQVARALLDTMNGRDCCPHPAGALADLQNRRALVDYCSHLWNNGTYATDWPNTPGSYQYRSADHQAEIDPITRAFGGTPTPIPPTPPPPGVTTQLVRQDQSDCVNSDVQAGDPARVGGVIAVTRLTDGSYTADVSYSAGTPNTTYHVFLKCVRLLGDVTTDGSGRGTGRFTFGADEISSPFAFDSYPEGAPSGNKFQSVQVRL